jgi:anti-sigma factor RsiW
MDCADLEANLTDFLDGLLDPASESAALEHLATCERCEAVLTETRSVIELAARHGRVELPPTEREQLLQRILSDDSVGE